MQVSFPDCPDPKRSLRSTMRRLLRDSVNDPRPVQEHLGKWLAAHPGARVIAVYSALTGEVNLTEITARHRDRRWVYPRIAAGDLVFHEVTNPAADLSPGSMGIQEPSVSLPQVGIEEIDAFLCPGLAFDARGGRLGRGRGFYDRVLSHARPDALKLGVCFPTQLVPDTFAEAHDIAMDEVICG